MTDESATFEGLKKDLREPLQTTEIDDFKRGYMRGQEDAADDLESLEQRVRELRGRLESGELGLGSQRPSRSIVVEELTALLGEPERREEQK